mgnify:FL=1
MKKLVCLLLTVLCVFALAGCGSTEWTMIDMKGQESQLSAQDAAAVDQCLKGSWEDDTTNCEVVTLKGEGRWVTYCPDCGIFNDLNSGRNLTLSDSAREDMNTRLGQYGSLWAITE